MKTFSKIPKQVKDSVRSCRSRDDVPQKLA